MAPAPRRAWEGFLVGRHDERSRLGGHANPPKEGSGDLLKPGSAKFERLLASSAAGTRRRATRALGVSLQTRSSSPCLSSRLSKIRSMTSRSSGRRTRPVLRAGRGSRVAETTDVEVGRDLDDARRALIRSPQTARRSRYAIPARRLGNLSVTPKRSCPATEARAGYSTSRSNSVGCGDAHEDALASVLTVPLRAGTYPGEHHRQEALSPPRVLHLPEQIATACWSVSASARWAAPPISLSSRVPARGTCPLGRPDPWLSFDHVSRGLGGCGLGVDVGVSLTHPSRLRQSTRARRRQ
jgi:hypothetical protein